MSCVQTWFHMGDKNDRCFQTMARISKEQKTIRKVKDEHDKWFEDQKGLRNQLQVVYKEILQLSHHRQSLFPKR